MVTIIGIVSYGGWHLKRYINYKYMYQSKVQVEMKPLIVRIENLEKRISELENKK